MTIEIRPDPSRRQGGFAVLVVPSAALPEATVTVSLLNPYNERYLGGEGFQSEPAAFGPYPVVREGLEARVTVGPEIVNQVAEYAQLRITLGSVTDTAIWPDTVVPAPGAARIGGLVRPGDRAAPPPAATLVGLSATAAAAAPSPAPEVPAPPDAPVAPAGGRRTGLLIGAGVLLLAAALAAALYLSGILTPAPPEDPVPAPEPAPAPAPAPAPEAAPAPEPAPAADPCASEALTGLRGQPFATVGAQLRSCGAAVSADTALLLIEDGAAADDPAALLLFGTLYDAEVLDPDFETAIGLAFSDSPAIAADYYARARAAGADGADARLQSACARLGALDDTTSRSVHDRLCGP